MKSSVRKTLYLFAVLTAVMVVLLASTVPAGALNPGGGAGVVRVNPHLLGKKTYNTLGGWTGFNGQAFPCQGGGGAALSAFSQFLGGGDGFNQPNGFGTEPPNHSFLKDASGQSCFGQLYSGANAAFTGSGTTLSGQTFSFTGSGTMQGVYVYSEPCQDTPAGKEAETGEAIGTLRLTVTGAGLVGTTPITSATVEVGFWWSRVVLTAVVGIKGVTITSAAGTVSDPDATGLATAIFIPTSPPNCNSVGQPDSDDIHIFSNTITVG